MIHISSRLRIFVAALYCAFAALYCAFRDLISKPTLPTRGPSLERDNRRCFVVQEDSRTEPSLRARVVPLNVEFKDLFESKRKFVKRLQLAAFTDSSADIYYSNYSKLVRRERLLRSTAVMPSVAVHALARKIGFDPRNRLIGINFPYYLDLQAVAREIGTTSDFVGMCWSTEVDLDAQWHALRNELQKIRAEWAESAARKADA